MKRALPRVHPSCEAAVKAALYCRPCVVKTTGDGTECSGEAEDAATCTLTIDRSLGAASVCLASPHAGCPVPGALARAPEPWLQGCGGTVLTFDFSARTQLSGLVMKTSGV